VLLGGLLLRVGVELHDPIGQELALVRPHRPFRDGAAIAAEGARREGQQRQTTEKAFAATKNRR
jgi:hypothetical protein